MYSNFPLYGNGVWVFGKQNKQTEFLFYAEYGDLNLDNGNRAVKQKCRKLKKEKGFDYFYFDDLREMHRRIYGAKYTTNANEITNFPYELYEEKCK